MKPRRASLDHVPTCHSHNSFSTASTADCDSSISSRESSIHTAPPARPSIGRRSHSEWSLRPKKQKSVTFSIDEDGEVTVVERRIAKRLQKNLWWTKQEMQKIRSDCLDTVQHVRSTGEYDSEQEIRGLERYINDDYDDESVQEYRRSILQAQEFQGFAGVVSKEAAKVSRAAEKKAHRLAKSDTREALKSAFTRWEDGLAPPSTAHSAAVIVD